MTSSPPWDLEFFEDSNGNQPCRRWIERDLAGPQKLALIAGLERILAYDGLGVCGTEHGKQLGEGLFEYRLRHTAGEVASMFPRGEDSSEQAVANGEEVLLRVFCHAYGEKIILLLGGYDKGADASRRRQQKEIRQARKRLREFKRKRRGKEKGKGGPAVPVGRRVLDWGRRRR